MSRFGSKASGRVFAATLLTSTMLAGVPAAFAAAADQPTALDEVIVTAQKREENVQRVPLSIQVLSTQKLDQLDVNGLNDYAKFLPSVSMRTVGPSFTTIYMRGVASGENANHSGPLPSVGVYLDEQPVTTITGPLNIHAYDLARVESLAGPQGTLYGASSEAGTIRIITNKPELGVFKGGYDVEANTVAHGSQGYKLEGFANVPLGERAAIRLVGWDEHDAGYIDNVYGERTYPTSGATVNNAGAVKDNYNDIDTYGGRLALKFDLNENWTITPTLMGQVQNANGNFAYDPSVGRLQVSHQFPEYAKDKWYQAALTVEGTVANFDIVYAGAFMKRHIESASDYSDYSFWYDTLAGYGSYWYDNAGNVLADPGQFINADDKFTKESHELRISSPKDSRFRVIGGLFMERQNHHIFQNYQIHDLADALEVPGHNDTLWLTSQQRIDRDYAAFGEASFDITPQMTLTGGIRFFKAKNSLEGFFGFGTGYSGSTGVAGCFGPTKVGVGPCENLDKEVEESGHTGKINLTYHLTDDKMVYATYSTGFRPGGINRRGTLPPYMADYLTNYEIGWKTAWLDGRLRWNAAVFLEKWDQFQFSFLGQNGLTNIKNAPQAEIKGVETDLTLRPDEHWTFSGAAAYTDAKLTKNYCAGLGPNGETTVNCPDAIDPNPPEAPEGTELPVTPKFKANGLVRYDFPVGGFDAHLQGAIAYQGSAWGDLRLIERAILGKQKAYTTVDLAAGIARDNWTLELLAKNVFDELGDTFRYAECATQVCGFQTYRTPIVPRTIAIRFGQRF